MAHKRKGDLWLIGGVLAVTAVLLLLLWRLSYRGQAVEITVDGTPVATLPLDTPAELSIPGVDGGTNTLIIQDGVATVTYASCPDHICMRTGGISRTGQSIVCLPNRVVITVVGDTPSVDGEV